AIAGRPARGVRTGITRQASTTAYALNQHTVCIASGSADRTIIYHRDGSAIPCASAVSTDRNANGSGELISSAVLSISRSIPSTSGRNRPPQINGRTLRGSATAAQGLQQHPT